MDESVKEIERLRKKKLMLIDDNIDMRKSFEYFIKQMHDKNVAHNDQG
ncbi:MAG: hypothetical protein L0H53_04650 [Candidatus Nitrosocosmicus sp.]|nr:hypothetical protein [Candidatus Nitrosocosmicus sp.]MDN5867323.1 hypothetical protein [Candidatus Nitrosocosmicus sp.]